MYSHWSINYFILLGVLYYTYHTVLLKILVPMLIDYYFIIRYIRVKNLIKKYYLPIISLSALRLIIVFDSGVNYNERYTFYISHLSVADIERGFHTG